MKKIQKAVANDPERAVTIGSRKEIREDEDFERVYLNAEQLTRDELLRLHCLREAVISHSANIADDSHKRILKRARKFEKFVRGD